MLDKHNGFKNIIAEIIKSLDDNNNESFINFYRNPENEAWNYKSEETNSSILIILTDKGLIDLLYKIINITKEITTPENFINFINSQNNKGMTVLHFAFYKGYMKLIRFLLNLGADYSLKGNAGLNCIHYSAITNKVTPIYYMIEKCKIDKYDKDKVGNTFFHWACYYASEKVINFFLNDIKFNINIKNKEGFTPLQYYILSKNTKSFKKFILRGADPYIKNKEGENSFDIVNKKYKNDINKNNIINILKKKYYINLKFFIFIIFHFLYPFIIIIFEFPFINIKENKFFITFIIYIIWTFLIWLYIIYFIQKDPGYIKSNFKNFLLNLIEKGNEYNLLEENNEIIDISKYCIKCKIEKDYHIKHCFFCDKCINEFDHHCYWVKKCVGKNNKEDFNNLLILLLINSYFIFILCILALINKNLNENVNKIAICFKNILKLLVFGDINLANNLKLFFIILSFLSLILIHIGTLPLIHSPLKKKYNLNNNYEMLSLKKENLIENMLDSNDEVIKLLEDN